MSGTPVIQRAKIKDLRLGYTIVSFRPDGRWHGDCVSYLAEDNVIQGNDFLHIDYFALSQVQSVYERLQNPAEHMFDVFPLPDFLVDTPQEFQRHSNAAGHIVTRIPGKPETQQGRSYDVSRKDSLLKHVAAEDLDDLGLDHRVVRYAAQSIYPGANVTMRDAAKKRQYTGRVKAVGFGIGGAVFGVLLHKPARGQTGTRPPKLMESDFWVDAADVDIAVHDKHRPGVVTVNFHHLRDMTVN